MTVKIIFVCVAVCSLHIIPAAFAWDEKNPRAFVYPGPVKGIEIRQKPVNKTDPCEHLTYCAIKPHDYPQERYNKMYRGQFKEPIFTPSVPQTDDRQADPDLMNNCASNVSFKSLYKVQSQTGEWRTVIQAPEENFLQMVRLETCKEADSPCFTSFESPDFVAKCKQGYNSWEFLVDDNKGSTETIHVDLPVCCSCHYSKNS